MAYNNLSNYYRLTFQLMQHHKYSITELENMIPFERDIYVALLMDYLEEENQRAQQRK